MTHILSGPNLGLKTRTDEGPNQVWSKDCFTADSALNVAES